MVAVDKFPSGTEKKVFAISQYKGFNSKAQRPAIDDNEFYWLQNMMPIGAGNLRTLYSNGTSIYTAAGGLTIVSTEFYNIGANNYCAIFLSDGTADQVNTATNVVTHISATPGTFYGGGTSYPDLAQYGNSGVVIVSSSVGANAYWAWDGTTLFAPGAASPTWLNGGTATTMPSGVSGSSIEIYQGHVWVGNGNKVTFSAPSNGADFATSDGGGTFTSTDSFLRNTYMQLRQANGFLYLFGDSSVNVISNVQSAGSPVTTTFNNQNVDPQVGTPWHNSVQAFGRGLIYANTTGVFRLFGGAAEKISDPLDGLFANANFTTGITPHAAVGIIFGVKVYCLLLQAPNQAGVQTNMMVCWDDKKWFLATQDASIVEINTQEINSNMIVWGDDGTKLYPLFQTASNTLSKTLQTKLWGGDGFILQKKAYRFYNQIRDLAGTGITATLTVDADIGGQSLALNTLAQTIHFTNGSNQVINLTNVSGGEVVFSISFLFANYQDVQAYGNVLGFTVTSSSSDFVVVAMALLYNDWAPLGG